MTICGNNGIAEPCRVAPGNDGYLGRPQDEMKRVGQKILFDSPPITA